MKAITLYQPHATLMAIRAKLIETRPRKWNHRGLVAIHAGLSTDWIDLCREEPFKSVLQAAGYSTVRLPTVGVHLPGWQGAVFNAYPKMDTPQERHFGNYAVGRFGYVFDEIRKLPEPIPFKGHQGYWDFPAWWCDSCDGTGLMEGWNHRDGHPCPKCHGNAIVIEKGEQ